MVAEDIASESLIKLWQWIQDNPVENIEPILLSILRNKALDYLRHESMKQQVITRISEKQNEELALRLSSLEDCNPNEIYSLCLTDSDNNSYLISENPKERLAFAIPAWLGLSAEAIQALIALGLVVIVDGIAHILAEEKIQELKRKPELIYFRAVLDEEKKGVFLGDNITRQNALIIIQLNSSTTGVFCNGEKYARSLTETLNGPAKHCPGNHGLSQGYWNHYHCKKAPNTHIWYI